MKQNEVLKEEILRVVKRSGIPIRTQKIADRVTLPDDIPLSDLLDALVTEGRLTRGFTLLTNGEASHVYNLPRPLQPPTPPQ